MKYKGEYPSVYNIIDYGQKIGNEANKLAYPNNPKVAQYPDGHPTEAYKAAIKKEWAGKKYYWSKASEKGASCDTFVGTVLKAIFGKAIDIPRPGLWILQKYLLNSDKFKVVGKNTPSKIVVTEDMLQDGDIILYKKNIVGRHGHICIYYKGKIKEASANHYYARTTDQVKNRLSPKGKKYVYVFRAKDGKTYDPLQKGSKGDEVKKLQRYLNWYFKGDDELKPLKVDGEFGSITTGRVKLMQRQLKLVVDGVVGKKTLEAMKGVSK